MTAYKDISNQRFGRLVALSRINSNGKAIWQCKCDCGNFVNVQGGSLQSGNTKSCGCLQRDAIRKTATKHGMAKTLTHRIWCGIITRCTNENHHSFTHYGARGINVCDRWKSFANFLIDMGECPPGHSIERRDVNGDYKPSNCHWATTSEQSRNTRKNVFLTFNGETLCQQDWAKKLGLHRETIARRIKLGWPVEKILTVRPKQAKSTYCG